MINGLGVVGWGVGGIEAEACMLGQPISMLLPRSGRVQAARQAARRLHRHRPGPHRHADAAQERRGGEIRRVLSAPAWLRCPSPTAPPSATWRLNMAPPSASSPSITQTLDYLRLTNRSAEQIALVEAYAKAQGLFLTPESPEPEYSDTLRARSRHRGPFHGRPETPAGSHQSAGREEEFPRRYVSRRRAEVGRDRDQRLEVDHPGRLGGDRRHHQLHQHLQPFGDDRRRIARQESRRERADDQAVGEVESRARLESRNRLS